MCSDSTATSSSTPPSTEANPDKSYPVFYLVSGTTDTEEVWFKVGRANTLLDEPHSIRRSRTDDRSDALTAT